jgi:hypothetical protein
VAVICVARASTSTLVWACAGKVVGLSKAENISIC